MEGLPLELLLDVLGPLPPRDLIAARSVCRSWRAAVNALEAQDRTFRFQCGTNDIVGLDVTSVRPIILEGVDWAAFPCTCGAINYNWKGDSLLETANYERFLAAFVRYGHTHSSNLPPARWELLARERKLAAHLHALTDRLWHDVHWFQYGHLSYGGLRESWVPCWFRLPFGSRLPRSRDDVEHLATALLAHAAFHDDDRTHPTDPLALLGDPNTAEAFYGGPVVDDPNDHDFSDDNYRRGPVEDGAERWMESWRVEPGTATPPWAKEEHALEYARTLRGWTRWQFEARAMAARWRCYVGRDRAQDRRNVDHFFRDLDDEVYKNGLRWQELAPEASIAAMDSAVATIDTIKAEVDSRVRYSTVVRVEGKVWWFGGLSPSGNLVGCMTVEVEND